MTVEEMRNKIKEKCLSMEDCYIGNCPLMSKWFDGNDWVCWRSATDEQIKENYKLMFGKEETEMKNGFDFNELKAGYAIKVPAYEDELLVGIPYKNDLVFYSKDFNIVVSKKEILGEDDTLYEEYAPIEVYGFSSDAGLFDPSTRPLLWKKEEDKNKKVYDIGKLNIKPNYNDGYKTEHEDDDFDNGFIYIKVKGDYDSISIHKSELDNVINALTEIRDFINED